MTRLTQLSLSSLTLGLLALGGASAAHATQCTVDSETVLESSLLTESGPGEGCGVDTSTPGEEETLPLEISSLTIWQPPQDGWHDGKYFKDGKECSPPVVPLPPSSLLLVSGALALLILGRRRRPATA